MFEFVKKVNEITLNKEHFSSKCIVGNLGWSILIERKSVEDDGEFEYVDSDWKGSLAVKVNVSFSLESFLIVNLFYSSLFV